MQSARRKLKVYIRTWYIAILVPKRRGDGYLKVPRGHHRDSLVDVEYEVPYDIFGLEGELEVMTGWTASKTKEEWEQEVIKPIADVLDFDYEFVDHDTFYALHPIPSK